MGEKEDKGRTVAVFFIFSLNYMQGRMEKKRRNKSCLLHSRQRQHVLCMQLPALQQINVILRCVQCTYTIDMGVLWYI